MGWLWDGLPVGWSREACSGRRGGSGSMGWGAFRVLLPPSISSVSLSSINWGATKLRLQTEWTEQSHGQGGVMDQSCSRRWGRSRGWSGVARSSRLTRTALTRVGQSLAPASAPDSGASLPSPLFLSLLPFPLPLPLSTDVMGIGLVVGVGLQLLLFPRARIASLFSHASARRCSFPRAFPSSDVHLSEIDA